jgi:ABC-type Fe3+ transport system substrate-binding protein
VALARPTKSTSSAAMMQLVTEIYGWEEGWMYLASMAAVARFVDSSGAVRDTVKRGEALFGPMVDYFVFIAGLQYCIPTDGTDILFDPVAVPKSANRTAAAVLTRVFLTEAPKNLVDRYILPGNPALLDSPDVNKTKAAVLKQHLSRLMEAKILAIPPEKSASYYYSFIYYYEATLVDLQDQLTSLWAQIVAYYSGKINQRQFEELWRLLGAPVNYTDPATGQVKTFTYQEAVAVNNKVASDPAYRDRLYQAWREAASRKYQQVKTLLNQYIQQNMQQTTTTTTATAKADLTYGAVALAVILAVVVIFLVLKRR